MTFDATDRHASPERSASNSADACDVSGLAIEALSRLCREAALPDLSEEARAAMQSPFASAIAYALCDEDDDCAEAIVEDLLDAGLSVEDLCLDHLAPAARCLGEWWDRDKVPFTDVAMASARIQRLLRRMPRDGRVVPCPVKGAVFAAVPGEQHTLGVMMAAELFRRHGWDVDLLLGFDQGYLVDRILGDDRPVIGLSCGGAHSFQALRSLMETLNTQRPDARILLSGQVVDMPERLEGLPGRFDVVRDMADAMQHMACIAAELDAARAIALAARASSAA